MNSPRDGVYLCNLHEDLKQETHVAWKLKPPAKTLRCHMKPQRKRWLNRQLIGPPFFFFFFCLEVSGCVQLCLQRLLTAQGSSDICSTPLISR